MKRCILFLALSFLLPIIMMAQNAKPNQEAPKEDIRVNREYDEKGNLIRFDSVYSYSFSGDTTLQDLKFGEFPDPFGEHFNFFSDSAFNQSFFKDFDPLFFNQLGEKQDSLMNQFFQFHQFNFKNDSTGKNMKEMEEFFKQFQEFEPDSGSTQHFMNEFNFSPGSMFEMMQKQMQEMEELQRQYFSK